MRFMNLADAKISFMEQFQALLEMVSEAFFSLFAGSGTQIAVVY